MADNRTKKRAEDRFLQQERGQVPKVIIVENPSSTETGTETERSAVPKIIIGDVSTSPTIGAEGLTLTPAKRTKEEEERIAKTKGAVLTGPGQIQQSGGRGVTTGMGGRRITRP